MADRPDKTIPMPRTPAADVGARTTQPAGTPKGLGTGPRDTIKTPPHDAEQAAAREHARAMATTRREKPEAVGGNLRNVPMEERPTLPLSEKQESRAIVVPKQAVSGAPAASKIDLTKADLRRAPTAKITKRPNEYIPRDDSDILGPAPGAKPPYEGRVAQDRSRQTTQSVPRRRPRNDMVLASIAIIVVCAIAAVVTWFVVRSQVDDGNAPAPSSSSR